MSTFETIDRKAAKQLSDEVQTALREVAERHGLTLKVGGGKFDPGAGTFMPRVEFAMADSGKREWERSAFLYDLQPEDYGREFTTQGRTFRLSGLSPKSPKRPVLAQEVGTERTFKFTPDGVKRALSR